MSACATRGTGPQSTPTTVNSINRTRKAASMGSPPAARALLHAMVQVLFLQGREGEETKALLLLGREKRPRVQAQPGADSYAQGEHARC